MGSSFSTNSGLYGLPLDVWMARDTHLGMGRSFLTSLAKSLWQKVGSCRRMGHQQRGTCHWHTGVSWSCMERSLRSTTSQGISSSTRVFVTVLNTSTESGSPWYTPIRRWMGLVVQDLVDTTSVRSWYRVEIVLTITCGAW